MPLVDYGIKAAELNIAGVHVETKVITHHG